MLPLPLAVPDRPAGMSVVDEPLRRRAQSPTPAPAVAFGLAIRLGFRCAGLGASGQAHGDCQVDLGRADLDELALSRGALGWTKLGDDRLADGTITTTLERHPELGYRFVSTYFGVYLLSSDGRRARCAAESVDPWLVERFVIG